MKRIEGFDISNISGKEAVGSMVVFVEGKPARAEYRRFRIRTVSGIDDYKMMQEVIPRRYSRAIAECQPLCDLAVIDGGRVVAEGTPTELKRGLNRDSVRLTWQGPTEEQLREVSAWAGEVSVGPDGSTVHVTVDDAATFVPRIFALAPGAIRAVSIEAASLEDAYFRHVTRRSSREQVGV